MNTSNPDYADLKWAYNMYPYNPQYGHNVPHHNLMATPKYRQELAQGIFEWAQNTGAGITQEECYALTQEGLVHTYVPVFAPLLSQAPNTPKSTRQKLLESIYVKSRQSHCN
jgi:hypothetical protein